MTGAWGRTKRANTYVYLGREWKREWKEWSSSLKHLGKSGRERERKRDWKASKKKSIKQRKK